MDGGNLLNIFIHLQNVNYFSSNVLLLFDGALCDVNGKAIY